VRYWVGIPMRRKAKRIFKDYLAALAEVVRLGDAREESFYPALKGLLETLARELGYGDLRVTVQPRPTEAGNPDFRVWDGTSRVTGYLEAKPPETNLEKIESTEQLRRYRETFPNLILTNFLEFRLYREGRLVASARLGRPVALVKLSTAPPLEDPEGVLRLFEEFFAYSFARVLSAESLAVELAKRTRFLRDVVREELSRETSSGRGPFLNSTRPSGATSSGSFPQRSSRTSTPRPSPTASLPPAPGPGPSSTGVSPSTSFLTP